MKKVFTIAILGLGLLLLTPRPAHACSGLGWIFGVCLEENNQIIQDGMNTRAAIEAGVDVNQAISDSNAKIAEQNNLTARTLAEQQAAITQKSLELAQTAITEPNETQRELARSLALVGQQGVIGSAAVQLAEARAKAQTETARIIGNVLIALMIVGWLMLRSARQDRDITPGSHKTREDL